MPDSQIQKVGDDTACWLPEVFRLVVPTDPVPQRLPALDDVVDSLPLAMDPWHLVVGRATSRVFMEQ